MTLKSQQLSLNTAIIASCLYPALGGADARNDTRLMGAGVGESRFSPLRSPIAGSVSTKIIFCKGDLFY